MLPLPSTKNSSWSLKPDQAGVEKSMGASGSGTRGRAGQGRRGAEQDGLGKQQGLTHTHPQG